MYTKLYFIYYSFLKSRKSIDPTFNAASPIFLTQLIHLFIILKLIKITFNIDLFRLSVNENFNKILIVIILILWIYYNFISLRKKLKESDLKILLKQYTLSSIHVLYIFIISFILPLILLIYLSGGKLWK